MLIGAIMKFKQEMREEAGQSDKKRAFARFKERMEKPLRVAVAAFAVTFAVSCGDEPGPRDGGTGGDADVQTDGGNTTDGGSDGGNPAGLCTQYGTGDPHRMVFHLDDEASPSGGTHFFKFRELVDTGSELRAGFVFFPASMTTSEGIGFSLGQTKVKNITGVGDVSFQLCEMSASPCTLSTGDPNCSATLASSNGWQ
jgi:hypothetical protein